MTLLHIVDLLSAPLALTKTEPLDFHSHKLENPPTLWAHRRQRVGSIFLSAASCGERLRFRFDLLGSLFRALA
jgi:hypothetical protein